MPSSVQIAVPKESATVILVRSNPESNWEVFLACRHRNQSFMAAAYVFPGGQVDAADADLQLNNFIAAPDQFNPQALLQDPGLSPEMAQSIFICAIRETFEEAGILIAQDSGGHSLKFDSNQSIDRFADYRRELNAGQMTLKEIAEKENLLLSPEALVPYAHWITPEISPKRFSTRFFLAQLPEGQLTTTDCDELTDCLWGTPENILKMHDNKEVMLMPPTLKTLEELAAYTTIDALFSGIKDRAIYPILPQHSENFLKLPHDPEYGIEKFKVPARLDEPSRIIFTDGIWQTGFYPNK
ncbi:MAG: hypothetical protein CVU71_11165 [Deltaproteobacteria bacterium HGW-Deltaproteobacteria-6]|nr:MAG: hypothetical protein CVU71_11165 [Deltaproteobacteria bacterium HGW-Deltaproteobacteria-6]